VGRGDYVRFWHLTFQEYLTARALAARSEDEQRSVLLGQPKLYETEWKEAVLLMAGVLYHQGIKRVDGMVSTVLDQLGRSASVTDRALCVGLLGAAVWDLAPVNYQPSDPRYRQLLDEVMGVFKPDWLPKAQRRFGGVWSRLIGMVAPQQSQASLMRLAIQAADVLGQAGLPQFEPGRLDNEWVTIPAGKFLMGCQSRDPNQPNYDKEAVDYESPVHVVHLEEFSIARYPVTVAQYRRFVDSDGYQDERWWNEGGFAEFCEPLFWEQQLEYPLRPVVGVCWYEAAAYCVWAGVRLPTEAQWERAARGTDGRKYPWGNERPDSSRLNYGNSGVGHPTPVGIYPLGATPDGICDMAGNVWEWCADWSGPYPAEEVTNPRGLDRAVGRVNRGGCWDFYAGSCRVASRLPVVPEGRGGDQGFRVAAVPPGKSSQEQANKQAEPEA